MTDSKTNSDTIVKVKYEDGSPEERSKALISIFANFATATHFKQFRKVGLIPYASHCFEVQKMLVRCGVKDPIVLCAALAHDAIEDGWHYPEELKIFNPGHEKEIDKIVKLVNILTLYPGGCKDEYMQKFVTSCLDSFHIKCADRICNVTDFFSDDNKKYAEKYFHKADILWDRLNKENDEISKKLKKRVDKLRLMFINEARTND